MLYWFSLTLNRLLSANTHKSLVYVDYALRSLTHCLLKEDEAHDSCTETVIVYLAGFRSRFVSNSAARSCCNAGKVSQPAVIAFSMLVYSVVGIFSPLLLVLFNTQQSTLVCIEDALIG